MPWLQRWANILSWIVGILKGSEYWVGRCLYLGTNETISYFNGVKVILVTSWTLRLNAFNIISIVKMKETR